MLLEGYLMITTDFQDKSCLIIESVNVVKSDEGHTLKTAENYVEKLLRDVEWRMLSSFQATLLASSATVRCETHGLNEDGHPREDCLDNNMLIDLLCLDKVLYTGKRTHVGDEQAKSQLT